MSTQELDRSMLDGKDREELHAIAGAMGVKAPTRMRKSELIDAILDAAEGPTPTSDPGADPGSAGGDPDREARRTVRSARASELADDSVEALLAEEEALGAADDAPEPGPPGGSRTPSDDHDAGRASTESSPDDGSSRLRRRAGRLRRWRARLRRRAGLVRRGQHPPAAPPTGPQRTRGRRPPPGAGR